MENQQNLFSSPQSELAPLKNNAPKLHKRIILYLLFILFSIIIFILSTNSVVRVSGNSMEPTISSNDLIFYNKLKQDISYGDILVFMKAESLYIKRVYALPGDKVEITISGVVLVNDSPLIIEGLNIKGVTQINDMAFPIILNESEYFVLGDNRAVSIDSRNIDFGTVEHANIVGKVLFK